MADKQPIKPGDVLADRYRVRRVLGQGGMGIVFAAQDQELRRPVALKVLLPGLVDDADSADRFLREARAAVRLTGEHSVRVHDVRHLEDGTRFIVMELLVGQDLDTVRMARGRLPVQEAVDWILQAAEGVAEAHAHGIVHRDLKPRNLFLTKRPDGSPLVKVLDFGLAKAPRQKGDRAITSSLTVMGSPDYMSPEQLRGTRDVDARTDIWSLGVCAYELLVGELPFAGATLPDLTVSILERDARPPHTVFADIPFALSTAVLQCLEKRVADRFADVADLAAAFDNFASLDMRGSAERVARVLRSRGVGTDPMKTPPTGLASRGPYETTVAAHRDTAPASTMDSRPRRGKKLIVRASLIGLLAGASFALFLSAVWTRPRPVMPAAPSPPSAERVASTGTALPGPDPTSTATSSSSSTPASSTNLAASAAPPPSRQHGRGVTLRSPPVATMRPATNAASPDATAKPLAAPSDLGSKM